MIFDHISHIRLYSRSSRFVIMYTLIVEKDLLFCITNNEISVQEISRILSVKKQVQHPLKPLNVYFRENSSFKGLNK